jgi:hypothetical protein
MLSKGQKKSNRAIDCFVVQQTCRKNLGTAALERFDSRTKVCLENKDTSSAAPGMMQKLLIYVFFFLFTGTSGAFPEQSCSQCRVVFKIFGTRRRDDHQHIG